MKTRDRILATSLAMFNELGESNVSTNHIADEMEISPGNLYYHFANKEAIVDELFDHFVGDFSDLLDTPQERAFDLEDTWFFTHVVFEKMAEYRFLFRDLVNILSRYRHPRILFRKLLQRQAQDWGKILGDLKAADALDIATDEVAATVANLTLVSTYWLNFSRIQKIDATDSDDFNQAVYQTLSLLQPYLQPKSRSHLAALAATYL